MKIKLWPDLVDWPLEASVTGDVITINGEPIDLSGIPEDYRLPGSAIGNKFFLETDFVQRIGKTLHFTLRLPVSWNSPEEYRNPSEPIIIDARSGLVKFPDTSPPKVIVPEVVQSAEQLEAP
ncbi:hypothetical protein [Pseudomonas azotoformans]